MRDLSSIERDVMNVRMLEVFSKNKKSEREKWGVCFSGEGIKWGRKERMRGHVWGKGRDITIAFSVARFFAKNGTLANFYMVTTYKDTTDYA